MSSTFSTSRTSLTQVKGRAGAPAPSPYSTLPQSLCGQLAQLVGDLSVELEADLGAALADRLDGPFRRSALIGVLFRSAFPVEAGGAPALQPTFAIEAMSRARSMFGLVLVLEKNSWHECEPWYPDVSPLNLHRELALAWNMVSLFEALSVDSGYDQRPCGEILVKILSGFVELFGPGIGRLSLEFDVATVQLAGFKRRALVLAAVELINHSMLYSLQRPHSGHFRVSLKKLANGRGGLILEHDGKNVELIPPRESFSVLSAMAALLEAEFVCRRSALGGPSIEFHFPC